MSHQEFCKHFTREWVSNSELSLQTKKDLGEHKVLDALLVLKEEDELINSFFLIQKGGNPDIYAEGNNKEYLFEVKNNFYTLGYVPNAPYPGFYEQSYNWALQVIQKDWSAREYGIRATSGRRSIEGYPVRQRPVVTMRNIWNDHASPEERMVVPVYVSTWPSLKKTAEIALERFFGEKGLVFAMHPFIPEPPIPESCRDQSLMRLYSRLLKVVKRAEDSV